MPRRQPRRPEHRVELVQFFDACSSSGSSFFSSPTVMLIASRRLLLRLGVDVGERGDVHHQLLALGQELVQRRIERADDDREAVHLLEQAGEILALHRQELLQSLAAALLVARHDHRLHVLDTILGEEHVLGAAQANSLGAELARHLGVARDVRVRAHAKLAAELIGPTHERGEQAGTGIRLFGSGLAGEHFTGRAIERQPVAFLQREVLPPLSATLSCCLCSSTVSAPAPATQGIPMPRATTAAWLVMPPRDVRMPFATSMPWMSSGTVSARTRMTGAFCRGNRLRRRR